MTRCTFVFRGEHGLSPYFFFNYKDNIPKILRCDINKDILTLKMNKIREEDVKYICEQIYCKWRFDLNNN